MRKSLTVFSAALTVALGCAQAQDLHTMQACTQLSDDAARLSCYDAAMGVQKSAPPTKPRPAASEAAGGTQSRFGDDGRFHTETKTTLPKSLSAQVRDVAVLAAGRYRLTLDNGQVWETTQAVSAVTFQANDAITISRGVLGSYQISLTGHNTAVSATRKQ